MSVNIMSFFMYVNSPPPVLWGLSFLTAVKLGIFGILLVFLSFVSCSVIKSMSMLGLSSSSLSSSILDVSPFMFSCSILIVFLFDVC